jgi:3-hydroxyisobutyrate dehydrogenase
MKAFLGTGLLGSGFVRAMIGKGEEVQVWNRTRSKAKDLEQYGAKAFEDAVAAVAGATRVHLALKDDAAVNEVLQAAASGMAPGTIIIDHTTTSKQGAIERSKEWKERGFYYQHAPVFMGPVNALESTGFMMLSGDREVISQVQVELSELTGKLLDFGNELGKAAAIKLVGNAFLVCFTASIRDMLILAKELNLSVAEVTSLFEDWNPGSQLLGRLKRMTSGDYSKASWELAMARKDTGLFLDVAKDELLLIPMVAELMDEWIKNGYGKQDWTVIAKGIY